MTIRRPHDLGRCALALFSFLNFISPVFAASPGASEYPWDFRKNSPKYFQTYLKLLPMQLKKTPWFGRFDGTGTPVERVSVNGKAYLAGGICKPHQCGDNNLTFLIEADGSRAVAMVRAVETGGQIVALGNPTVGERQFMAKEFQN